jgi:hypothetical protein
VDDVVDENLIAADIAVLGQMVDDVETDLLQVGLGENPIFIGYDNRVGAKAAGGARPR